ncbi:DUF937 domain-containing protein [Flavobacterium aquicola]|uniref:Uncharacterized protein DUF937 n=1 Tax=Flavobacterium aquicola TaxID=1682742 RepID=A0A3E0EUH0_9FLAO|nr:DUF937 domain-containing protein [Flavobacterium aquicola]REH01833.1 uncharacterized protein DUF937 [Flavobacterium aquicola]
MFEQLTQLVQQFGQDDVVKNNAVPNEQNDAVMQEAGSSIFSSLQKMASEGEGIEKLAGLLQGNNAQNGSNPAVQEITQQLTGSLGEKFGLDSSTASGVAGSIIPKVLGGLVNKANDPNDSFQITDLIGAISGGGAQTSGIMDTISKYGTQFGLDQNADGKLDLSDAIAATQNKGGIGGFLGKLFGK